MASTRAATSTTPALLTSAVERAELRRRSSGTSPAPGPRRPRRPARAMALPPAGANLLHDGVGGLGVAGVVDGHGEALAARRSSAVAAPMPREPPVINTSVFIAHSCGKSQTGVQTLHDTRAGKALYATRRLPSRRTTGCRYPPVRPHQPDRRRTLSMPIDYYFAPQSPWTYLGHARFVADGARRPAPRCACCRSTSARCLPVSGGLPLGKRAPQRQAYRLVELQRFADHLGVPINLQAQVLSGGGRRRLAPDHRGRHGGRQRRRDAPGRCGVRAVWAQERDIADAGVLADLLAECGLDPARLEQSREPGGAGALRGQHAAGDRRRCVWRAELCRRRRDFLGPGPARFLRAQAGGGVASRLIAVNGSVAFSGRVIHQPQPEDNISWVDSSNSLQPTASACPPMWPSRQGKPRGAVVVVQEIFGVNSHIRGVADGYAAAGLPGDRAGHFHRVAARCGTGLRRDDMRRPACAQGRGRSPAGAGVMADIAGSDRLRGQGQRRQGRHRRVIAGAACWSWRSGLHPRAA